AGHPCRIDAHRRKAEVPGFPAHLFDLTPGGVRLEQGVVDDGGNVARGAPRRLEPQSRSAGVDQPAYLIWTALELHRMTPAARRRGRLTSRREHFVDHDLDEAREVDRSERLV